MRKIAFVLLTSAALAATSLAPAFAAAKTDSANQPKSVYGAANPVPAPASINKPIMHVAMAKKPAAAQVAMATSHYRPRLSSIVTQLNKMNHRINVDARRGFITKAERASLTKREHQLRLQAIHTASRQNGVLHTGQYVAFNAKIHDLGKKVHYLAE